MSFNSPIFLFLFLPLMVLLAALLAALVGKRGRNVLLLAASLFFYAWSDPIYLPVILAALLVNYWVGKKTFR